MLGEDHSLLHEFPDLKETILNLAKADENFAIEAKKYDELDRQIRKLELRNSPISDEDMHQLKHDRSLLKDDLLQKLKHI